MTERLINGYLIDVARYLTVTDTVTDSGHLFQGWRYSVKNPERQTVGVGDGFETSQAAKDAATRTALTHEARSRRDAGQ